MQLTNAIIHDVLTYYHLNRTIKRYKSQGKEITTHEHACYISCKNRLYTIYKLTGINMITVCDESIVSEWLKHDTTIAVAYIPTRNLCCLSYMAYTVALMYNIDTNGYQAMYSYHTLAEAREAFNTWDGYWHPPGNWIKHKGDGPDFWNPNYISDTNYAS